MNKSINVLNRALFELDMRERDDGVVTLSNLSTQAVHIFMDFAYSGEIEIREDNVFMLFQLASFLQVRPNYDYYYYYKKVVLFLLHWTQSKRTIWDQNNVKIDVFVLLYYHWDYNAFLIYISNELCFCIFI